jgi:ribosome-binding protein aMBF1 (putative translation factor)
LEGTGVSIGATIAAARRERGLRQVDLAELVCCSVQAIRFYEQGRRKPLDSIREMLERVLGVEL